MTINRKDESRWSRDNDCAPKVIKYDSKNADLQLIYNHRLFGFALQMFSVKESKQLCLTDPSVAGSLVLEAAVGVSVRAGARRNSAAAKSRLGSHYGSSEVFPHAGFALESQQQTARAFVWRT